MNPATQETAAPAATYELIPHEWDETGKCLNPDEVAVDFGATGGKRVAVVLLGSVSAGNWHMGFRYVTKKGSGDEAEVSAGSDDFSTRLGALRAGLAKLAALFAGDKVAVKALEAFFDGISNGEQPLRSPANKPGQKDLPPLPAAVFAHLPVTKIEANPENARTDFEPLAMKELADSIAAVGLLEPILVRRLLADELDELPGVSAAVKAERFEIVAGERRHRAHIMLKRETIPCMLYEGVTRAQAAAAALVENLQREGLNPIEEAVGYKKLMESHGLTQEQCADRVGKSRPVVANALRVLALPEKVVKLLREGKLTTAHGVALARFKDFPKVVAILAEETLNQGATASMLEKGLPFEDELLDAEVVVECNRYEIGDEYPVEVRKHPAYFKSANGSLFCFEPAHWAGLVKAHKAEQAEKAKAARERELAKAKKKNGGMKSLADLPRAAYVEVRQKDPVLAALLPDAAVEDAKKHYFPGNVEICTRPALYKKIDEAVMALRNADRKVKLLPLIEKARKKILGTKKIGPRELTLLLLFGHLDDGSACIQAAAAKRQGVKFASKLTGWGVRLDADCLSAAASQDPVEYYRVLVDNLFEGYLEDDSDDVGTFEAASGSGQLVKWLLELEDFDLLEETKAGQKQLVETVKATDWYKKELAAIEAEETAGKGKAGK